MSNNLSDDTSKKAKDLTVKGLSKLLRFLIQRYSASNRLTREKLNQHKIEQKLKNKSGYIALKKLQKSNEKLRPLTIPLSDEQLKRFNYFAKKYGVIYSSVSNQSQEGIKNHHIIIREKDLPLVKDITDRMNEEIRLKDYDDRINELEKMENRTPEQEEELKNLYEQKDVVMRNGTREFNDENADIVFNDVCGDMQGKSMDFNKVLNRFTDRDFSRDIPYYVCERTNPTSYIELKSNYDNFNGEQYTRTDYKVFNNGEEKLPSPVKRADGTFVVGFTDERFEGRPKGYWQNLKSEMKEKGGFSEDMVIFNTKEEFERYQQLYAKSIAEQSVEQVIDNEEGYRDFSNIQEQLTEQLKEHNAELNHYGKAIDSDSKEVFALQAATTNEEKLRISECIVISKQMANYEKLNELQTQLAIDKQQLTMNEGSMQGLGEKDSVKRGLYTKMQAELQAKVDQSEKGLEKALQTEKELNADRKSLIAVKAVDEVDKEYIAEKEREGKANTNLEKSDRNEKIEEERDTQSMAEWKEQISEDKQHIEKSDLVQDRNVTKTTMQTPTKVER